MPVGPGLRPKGAQGAAGDQMALEVGGFANGSVHGDKRWADPGDLKRCILTGNALSGVKEPEEPQAMRRHSS